MKVGCNSKSDVGLSLSLVFDLSYFYILEIQITLDKY